LRLPQLPSKPLPSLFNEHSARNIIAYQQKPTDNRTDNNNKRRKLAKKKIPSLPGKRKKGKNKLYIIFLLVLLFLFIEVVEFIWYHVFTSSIEWHNLIKTKFKLWKMLRARQNKVENLFFFYLPV
jgi:hypothetical protein